MTSAKAKARATEPGTTNGATYESFSNYPLFSMAGPSENDIVQGQIGDCYFLSVLSSVAKLDPNKIRQSILDMGDGTYLVQFTKGGKNVYVHVDGELPVLSDGQLDYAGLGAGTSTWVAIMEKAYAVFSGPKPSYASIDGGWMDEVYSALGDLPKSNYGGAGPAALISMIAGEISQGESVTYGTDTVTDGAPLIADHAYTGRFSCDCQQWPNRWPRPPQSLGHRRRRQQSEWQPLRDCHRPASLRLPRRHRGGGGVAALSWPYR